jgi:hypothetical protein
VDDKLQKALEFSNYLITFNEQKTVLQEHFKDNIVYYYNGAKFTITLELLSYCKSCVDSNRHSEILVDDNCIPFKIDIAPFYFSILNLYNDSKEKYFEEYSKLIKSRTVKTIVDYE